MKLTFDKYFKQLSILVILLIAFVIAWNMVFPEWKAAQWWPFYLAFFFIITTLTHYTLLKSLKNSPGKFIGMFMAVTLGKLLVYLIAIMLNVIYAPFHKLSIIAPFLLFYLVFTFFEVKQLSSIAGNRKIVSDEKKGSTDPQ